MKTFFLKRSIPLAVLLLSSSVFAQNVGINTTGASPDATAMLDITSSTKGLLIPRLALTATNSNAPVGASVVTSLLVYNTATAGASPNDVSPGYYYWNGAKWLAFGGTGGKDWSLTGNAGTTAGSNFIGTTDANDFAIYSNNTERMRIISTGHVGIGTSSPLQMLHVTDDILIGGGQAGDYDGNTEHLKIWAQSKVWNIGVVNDALSANSDFFISQIDGTNDGTFNIDPNGNISVATGTDNHRMNVVNTTAATDVGAVYGQITNTTAAKNAYGILGYNTNDIDATIQQVGVYGNSGTGHIAVAGRYSSTIFGYIASSEYGIYGRHDNPAKWAGYFQGDVHVNGTLSKSAGSFKIDHPMDPENKYLVHSFVESPDMMNVYNGNVITDSNGFAVVELPNYFNSLNKDYRYQLTPIGQFAQAIILEKVNGNVFKIKTDQPNVEVSWQVTGIRNDPFAQKYRIQAEEEKSVEDKGKYLNPSLYNQPESSGLHFHSIENSDFSNK